MTENIILIDFKICFYKSTIIYTKISYSPSWETKLAMADWEQVENVHGFEAKAAL